MSWLRASAVVLLATVCLGALAQDTSGNDLLVLMPQLRKMPAPTWLKEGVRVTYTSIFASVPAERYYWYKDHNDAWNRADEVGPAGGGFVQYQVLTRSTTAIIGSLDSIGVSTSTGVLVPASAGGAVDPTGAGACWVNPQGLARATRFQSREMRVTRGPYPLGGHTYDSIRLHYVAPNAVTDEVYDLTSGILLLCSKVVLSADGAHTSYTQMRFTSRRQTQILAPTATAPDWSAPTKQLAYQGALTTFLPGSPQFPLPLQAVFTKTGGGTRWARYRIVRQGQGLPAEEIPVYCAATRPCGDPWMAPAALQALGAGQTIDRDPHTGMVTRVQDVSGAGASRRVTIVQEGAGYSCARVYDAAGRLLVFESAQQIGPATQQTHLELVQ